MKTRTDRTQQDLGARGSLVETPELARAPGRRDRTPVIVGALIVASLAVVTLVAALFAGGDDATTVGDTATDAAPGDGAATSTGTASWRAAARAHWRVFPGRRHAPGRGMDSVGTVR